MRPLAAALTVARAGHVHGTTRDRKIYDDDEICADRRSTEGKGAFFCGVDANDRHPDRNRALKLGMDIRPFIKDGTITVKQIDPAEISPGELTSWIRNAVATAG